MMLEPPDSLAASYRLVPLIDIDMVMLPREWSKQSSCGRMKHSTASVKLHKSKCVQTNLHF